MEGILPPKIQWRLGKGNLSSNYRRKLLEYERDTVEKAIYKNTNAIESYTNIARLQSELDNHINNPMESNTMAICAATTLGVWLNTVYSNLIYSA